MRSIEVVVIGGGASGMAAAIEAAKAGKRVMILEKMNRLGKKILATGNGRCNFTNARQEPACYHGTEPERAYAAVKSFGFLETLEWFQELGVLSAEKDGYFYPASFQAAAVLHALERELKRLSVEVHLEEPVFEISEKNRNQQGRAEGFLIRTEKDSYLAKKIILSTGGLASPVHGSTGDGYRFLEGFGHSIIPVLPALTSLKLEEKYTKEWAGMRLQGAVTLRIEGEKENVTESGELQMTAYGVSGIPVFQVSGFAARALSEKRKVRILIDSFPMLSGEEVYLELLRRKKHNMGQSAGDLLEGMLPDKYAKVLLSVCSFSGKTPVKELTEQALRKIAEHIKCFSGTVREVSGFEKAQTSSGGIPLTEIDLKTFESLKKKHLYLCGELLDVDGICGGYNLQWAWTSGITAGRAIGSGERTDGQ